MKISSAIIIGVFAGAIIMLSCSSSSETVKKDEIPPKYPMPYSALTPLPPLIAAYNKGDAANFFVRLDSLDFKKCRVSEYEEKIDVPHSAIFGFPFTLEKDTQQVSLLLFDQENVLIDVIFNTQLVEGKYMTFFAPLFDKLPQGIYNLMLRVDDEKTFHKFTLLR